MLSQNTFGVKTGSSQSLASSFSELSCSGGPGSTSAGSPHPSCSTPINSTPSRPVPDPSPLTSQTSQSQQQHQQQQQHQLSTAPTSPTASGDSKSFVGPLLGEATSQEVQNWLVFHRFSNYTRIFQHFSGADLLRLSREDLIQICGLADGIRLDNALQSKSVRPRLTIFICQEPESVYHAVYMDCMTVEELKCKLAQLFGIQASQIGDIFMLGPSSIHIMVTDEVLHNTQDQSRFVVEGMREESGDKYRILLKSMQ